MNFRLYLCAGSLALPSVLGGPAALTTPAAPRDTALQASHQANTGELSLPALPWVADDPADSLYRAAREAVNQGEFKRAASMFAEIGRRFPNSAYAADALYYRAYALYRSGSESDLREARRSLESQRSRFPKAATTSDASTLVVRINGALAKRGDASSAEAVSRAASGKTDCLKRGDDENDVRTEAMNALLQMDAESALPIIKQVLQKRDGCSAALRGKAVFLLSQMPSSETEALLMDAILNDPDRKVREQAVFWLGQVHTEKAEAALLQIATSSDEELSKKAVFALGEQGMPRGQALVRKIAERDDSPSSAREQAIFQLGQRRSGENAEVLRALFAKLGKGNEGLRKNVLFSLSQMRGFGNDKWLLGIALDNSQSTEVRKHALWTAGQAGIPASELVSLYDRITDREIKEQLIWVLSDARDKAAADKLVEIAQRDKDAEMRKKAIFWLGQKNDPRVRQILLDIINKP